jgi:predicted CxxxxCH...CXXCH cytochrome family protein
MSPRSKLLTTMPGTRWRAVDWRRASVALAAVGLVACLEVRDDREVDGGGPELGCNPCHSPAGDSAAHAVHVGGGGIALLELDCAACHPVPSTDITDQHPDDMVQVVFPAGTLATHGGLEPSWDGTRCSEVYCHGATLGGGSYTAPAWEGEVTDGIQCGMCHSIPPPAPHVQQSGCTDCHSANYHGDGTIDTSVHVDGTLDLNGKGPGGGQ